VQWEQRSLALQRQRSMEREEQQLRQQQVARLEMERKQAELEARQARLESELRTVRMQQHQSSSLPGRSPRDQHLRAPDGARAAAGAAGAAAGGKSLPVEQWSVGDVRSW
jgi:hypothetical protein